MKILRHFALGPSNRNISAKNLPSCWEGQWFLSVVWGTRVLWILWLREIKILYSWRKGERRERPSQIILDNQIRNRKAINQSDSILVLNKKLGVVPSELGHGVLRYAKEIIVPIFYLYGAPAQELARDVYWAVSGLFITVSYEFLQCRFQLFSESWVQRRVLWNIVYYA